MLRREWMLHEHLMGGWVNHSVPSRAWHPEPSHASLFKVAVPPGILTALQELRGHQGIC